MKNKIHFIGCLFTIGMGLLTGCIDEIEGTHSGGKEINLQLTLPGINTRAGETIEDNNQKEAAEQNEAKITSLYFLAVNEKENGFIRYNIDLTKRATDGANSYVIGDMYEGTYTIYIVANVDVSTIDSETELKAKLLESSTILNTTTGSPLPMVYEQSGVSLTKGASTPQITAELTFACVKVRYAISFDSRKDNNGKANAAFQGKGLKITSLKALNIADKSAVITNRELELGELQTKSITETPTLKDGEENTHWALSGSFYLPEHYVTDDNKSTQTYLELKGKVVDADNTEGAECTYIIDLGHPESSAEDAIKQMPRGTLYDIKGDITKTGNVKLQSEVSIYNWTLVTINGDFTHTELWVSKTGMTEMSNDEKITVTSIADDYLFYKSNAQQVYINGKDSINGIPVITVEEQTGEKAESLRKKYNIKEENCKVLKLAINTRLELNDFQNRSASDILTFKANNLTKKVKVDYEVLPYLEVEKTEVIFKTTDTDQSQEIKFYTNLAKDQKDISLTKPADKDVQITSFDNNTRTGTIKITMEHNNSYQFTLSAGTGNDKRERTVNVQIKRTDAYRINFIAINSTLKDEGTNEGRKVPPQTLDANGTVTWGDAPQVTWAGKSGEYYLMKKDANSDQWYQHTIQGTPTGPIKFRAKDQTTYEYKNNNNTAGHDYPLQYPSSQEPGFPLFSFDNQEAWFVFDPTVANMQLFNFEPQIEDVTYHIYVQNDTEVQGMRWYANYGWIDSNQGQFLIQSEKDTPGAFGIQMHKTNLDDWYYCTVTLKSMKHNRAKNIKLLFRHKGGTIEGGTLFNGDDYSNQADGNQVYGYYYKDSEGNRKWSANAPTGLNREADNGTTDKEIGTLTNFTANGSDHFFLYFYKPNEPASWRSPIFGGKVYLHIGTTNDNNWSDTMGEMTKVSGTENWYYWDLAQNGYGKYKAIWENWKNNKYTMQIAFHNNKNKTEYDVTNKDNQQGQTTKANLWAWSSIYNNYFPDIKLTYGDDVNHALYFVDDKCYDHRIR